MDQLTALLKLADFSVAGLALVALLMLINVLNRIMEQLNRLREIEDDQTGKLAKLSDEVHQLGVTYHAARSGDGAVLES